MRYARLYAGADGVSRFEDVEVALPPVEYLPGEPPVGLARPQPAAAVVFARLPAGWGAGRHVSPRPQLTITLAGELEVVAGDGERRGARVAGPGRERLPPGGHPAGPGAADARAEPHPGGRLMYMRMSLARLQPGRGDDWRRMVDGYDPTIRRMPGFVAATYYCDDEAGLAGSLTVWESKEAAEAAAAGIDEKTREIMASMYRDTPTVQVLRVYEPTG